LRKESEETQPITLIKSLKITPIGEGGKIQQQKPLVNDEKDKTPNQELSQSKINILPPQLNSHQQQQQQQQQHGPSSGGYLDQTSSSSSSSSSSSPLSFSDLAAPTTTTTTVSLNTSAIPKAVSTTAKVPSPPALTKTYHSNVQHGGASKPPV
jgi:hypothetical protein